MLIALGVDSRSVYGDDFEKTFLEEYTEFFKVRTLFNTVNSIAMSYLISRCNFLVRVTFLRRSCYKLWEIFYRPDIGGGIFI